jgi:hypothetical protein
MKDVFDVDVWVRGTERATTETLPNVPRDAASWTDSDVRTLLTEMLLALERVRNPGGEPPPVVLRGFSWIVSPGSGGVLVHLEMQSGTASAGPFAIAGDHLTRMIAGVMVASPSGPTVH